MSVTTREPMLSEAPGSIQRSLGASFSFRCILQMIIVPEFSLFCLPRSLCTPAAFRLHVFGARIFSLRGE